MPVMCNTLIKAPPGRPPCRDSFTNHGPRRRQKIARGALAPPGKPSGDRILYRSPAIRQALARVNPPATRLDMTRRPHPTPESKTAVSVLCLTCCMLILNKS